MIEKKLTWEEALEAARDGSVQATYDTNWNPIVIDHFGRLAWADLSVYLPIAKNMRFRQLLPDPTAKYTECSIDRDTQLYYVTDYDSTPRMTLYSADRKCPGFAGWRFTDHIRTDTNVIYRSGDTVTNSLKSGGLESGEWTIERATAVLVEVKP